MAGERTHESPKHTTSPSSNTSVVLMKATILLLRVPVCLHSHITAIKPDLANAITGRL